MELSLQEMICGYLRTCCHCGSPWGMTAYLCPKCLKLINNFKSKGVRFDSRSPFLIKSLYYWGGDNPLISNLAYGLKRKELPWAYEKLGSLLLEHLSQTKLIPTARHIFLLPAPPSRPLYPNHAFQLACSIAQRTGWQVVDIIDKTNNSVGPQKGKSRSERGQIQYELKGSSGLKGHINHGNSRILFIDDVIASGSTARAAYKTLKEPRNFEAWSLFYRGLN